MHPAEQSLSLHVYRVGSFLGDDKVVKAQDKITTMYYLKGSRGDTQWHFALHADGPNGHLICKVFSGYTGPPILSDLTPAPILVNIASEQRAVRIERRRGAPGGTQCFQGLDDRVYYWRTSTCQWGSNMMCLGPEGELVATYRVTVMAKSKDGELCIYPPGRFMIDLLVATSLAIRMPSH